MQAASLEFKQYPSIVDSILMTILVTPYPFTRNENSNEHNCSLNIAWLSSDISYHPVGRFVLGLFSSINNPRFNHIIVDVTDHASESKRDWFVQLQSADYFPLISTSFPDRIDDIRSLNADIAIDLSGWTSGHFLRGFHSRLAPIQVSYLGYFASTGIPNMDYWLGDSALFPQPMCEWHSESIWRLPRCFIAWNPPNTLPEGNASLVSSSHHPSQGIHFGSFNHHRKLSDSTLTVWGKILFSVPDSRLSSNPNIKMILQVLKFFDAV